MTEGILESFIKVLFSEHRYAPESIVLYLFSGILAALVRLAIKDDEKAHLKEWWNDGSLFGAMVISIAGAFLFDNNFIWAFLGGYFITYVLKFIQKALEKAKQKKKEDSA